MKRVELAAMRRIVTGSREDAKSFTSDAPYAVISFVSTTHHRTPPVIQRGPLLRGRIIVRADDTLPDPQNPFRPLSAHDARRIVRFVHRMAPRIHSLFIHCVFGEGRSSAAAIAIARAYGLSWEEFTLPPYDPNPHVITEIEAAFTTILLGSSGSHDLGDTR